MNCDVILASALHQRSTDQLTGQQGPRGAHRQCLGAAQSASDWVNGTHRPNGSGCGGSPRGQLRQQRGNGAGVVSGDHLQRRRARERPEIGHKGSLGPRVGSCERASSRASNDADGRARGRPEHRRRRARRRWRSVAQGEVGCGGSFGAESGAFERGHRTVSNGGNGGR